MYCQLCLRSFSFFTSLKHCVRDLNKFSQWLSKNLASYFYESLGVETKDSFNKKMSVEHVTR
jgi:hypothetical protein